MTSALPSAVSDGEMVEYIHTGKADVIIYGDDYMLDIMQKNSGKYQVLLDNKKLRVYATTIGLPINDAALKNMLDNSIMELKGSAFIDKTLTKFAPKGSWLNAMP